MTKTTVHTVRLSPELTAKLDAEAVRRRKTTGEAVTKADVIRDALIHYLTAHGGGEHTEDGEQDERND